MITNTTLNYTASLLSGNTVTVPSHLAFGSTSVTLDPTDTSLTDEFDRVALSTVGNNNNTVTFEGIRTGTLAGNEYINTVGVLNASSSGDLWAVFLVPNLLHTTSFDVEAVIQVRVERG